MIYTINNCIRAFGYTNFDNLIADMGSVDNLREYVRANGYADIAVGEDTELLLVDVNGKTSHTGCYGAVIEPPKPYLCFTSTGDSSVAIHQEGTPDTSANKVIQYKLNNGQWQTWDLSEVSLHDGDKMYLKSDDEIPMGEYLTHKRFVMNGSIAASGNIMSLLNFSDTLPDYAFRCLFAYHCTVLTAAPELPATTLSAYCYSSMFEECTSLVQAPALPATTLAIECYNSMFSRCTSLTTAPALQATTLQVECYMNMFNYCTSLTQAPELPATELQYGCYKYMFDGCSNLNYVKAMFTDISSQEWLTDWLNSVSPTGTFIKSKDATWTNEQAGIPTGWTVQVEGGVTPEPEPERDYLCFTSTGDSNVSIDNGAIQDNKVIQYKLNNGQWQTWDLSAVSLHDGDKMYLKSDDEIPMGTTVDYVLRYKHFVMTGSIAASGNIMSLLNFSDTIPEHAFYSLFTGCTSLTTAPKLPATTLANGCYYAMFDGCTSLTTAPVLPATTLTDDCYREMFKGCTSLTAAPELQATTLAYSCYNGMFQGCTSLTQAPVLPVTTLEDYCYASMFSGCTSLVQAPELPATALRTNCYNNMFFNCTSLTQAPVLPATTLASYCYNGMFSYCNSLTQAPALPATTLAISCYNDMFSSCTSLTQAPALPATDLSNECYKYMFNNCVSLVQAPELPATTLVTNCYNNMFIYCLQLNYVKAMFTDISAENCLTDWLSNVSSTGTFVKNAAATWTNEQAGIPTEWTVQTASPDK